MARLIASVISLAVIFGIMWGVNACTAPGNNVTCKRQASVAGVVRYELCIAGQGQPQYVPYQVWSKARIGGYYDEGTRTAYSDVGDDPHVSHGLFGGDDDGHSVHFGGDE
jgi:hypothetical protein